jgi:hypothetical protein
LTSTIVNKDTMIDGEEVDFRRSNDTINWLCSQARQISWFFFWQ